MANSMNITELFNEAITNIEYLHSTREECVDDERIELFLEKAKAYLAALFSDNGATDDSFSEDLAEKLAMELDDSEETDYYDSLPIIGYAIDRMLEMGLIRNRPVKAEDDLYKKRLNPIMDSETGVIEDEIDRLIFENEMLKIDKEKLIKSLPLPAHSEGWCPINADIVPKIGRIFGEWLNGELVVYSKRQPKSTHYLDTIPNPPSEE